MQQLEILVRQRGRDDQHKEGFDQQTAEESQQKGRSCGEMKEQW